MHSYLRNATLVAAPAVAQVVSSPVAGITFGQLSMMYLDHLRVSGRTEKHIASLENLLKRIFFDILGKDAPVAGMTYLKTLSRSSVRCKGSASKLASHGPRPR